jgi:hypothetical protein
VDAGIVSISPNLEGLGGNGPCCPTAEGDGALQADPDRPAEWETVQGLLKFFKSYSPQKRPSSKETPRPLPTMESEIVNSRLTLMKDTLWELEKRPSWKTAKR